MAIFLGSGLALCLALTLLLWRMLALERAARVAADATLAARMNEAADRALRLDLLDRRRAAIAPIESLWLAWARGGSPDEALLGDAIRALAEARLLFADHLQAELDETALLIVEYVRCQNWQRDAHRAGRYDERADLIGEEIAREARLKPRVESLRIRLSDAARMA
jgi:hypothetical protein